MTAKTQLICLWWETNKYRTDLWNLSTKYCTILVLYFFFFNQENSWASQIHNFSIQRYIFSMPAQFTFTILSMNDPQKYEVIILLKEEHTNILYWTTVYLLPYFNKIAPNSPIPPKLKQAFWFNHFRFERLSSTAVPTHD